MNHAKQKTRIPEKQMQITPFNFAVAAFDTYKLLIFIINLL